MRKSFVVMVFIGVFSLSMAGMAGAESFTLDSYAVSLNTVDPGLMLYWNPNIGPVNDMES